MLKSIGDTIMQERFRMFRRVGGNYHTKDKITCRSESLGTTDLTVAKQLLTARNQAVAVPCIGIVEVKAASTPGIIN